MKKFVHQIIAHLMVMVVNCLIHQIIADLALYAMILLPFMQALAQLINV